MIPTATATTGFVRNATTTARRAEVVALVWLDGRAPTAAAAAKRAGGARLGTAHRVRPADDAEEEAERDDGEKGERADDTPDERGCVDASP